MVSETINWYAATDPMFDSQTYTSELWVFTILRRLDLDFPSLTYPTPIPDTTPAPGSDIAKLRVGGFATPPTFAFIAMLTGLAFVTLGLLTLKRRT